MKTRASPPVRFYSQLIRLEGRLLTCGKSARMENHRLRQVGQEILGAVVAGVDVGFVRDVFGVELPIKLSHALFKPKIIVLPTVEIDL